MSIFAPAGIGTPAFTGSEDAAKKDGNTQTVGQKKNFVADGHTVIFTSNGQAHHHWTPVHFRERTRLRQLSEHVLVVVETDPLPIAVRTEFFTADRSGVRASEEALRLESELAAFSRRLGRPAGPKCRADPIDDSVRPLTAADARDLEADQPGVHTSPAGLQVSGERPERRVVRATRPRAETAPGTALRPDVPAGTEARCRLPGKSKALRFVVDATDEFFSSRCDTLTVTCSHPDIAAEDIAVGPAARCGLCGATLPDRRS